MAKPLLHGAQINPCLLDWLWEQAPFPHTPGVGENGGGTIQPTTRFEVDFRRKGTKRGAA
jgi:hypothetical protein